jgi:hypothetical protein
MKTFLHLWQYIAEFFFEWEINVAEKIKIRISCSVTFSESRAVLWDKAEHVVEPEGPQMTSQHTRCMLDKQGYMHEDAHAQAPGYTHTHTHTHTHKYVTLIDFPRQ